jgi:hypothetical protein
METTNCQEPLLSPILPPPPTCSRAGVSMRKRRTQVSVEVGGSLGMVLAFGERRGQDQACLDLVTHPSLSRAGSRLSVAPSF